MSMTVLMSKRKKESPTLLNFAGMSSLSTQLGQRLVRLLPSFLLLCLSTLGKVSDFWLAFYVFEFWREQTKRFFVSDM